MLDHSVREYVAEKFAAMGLNTDPYGNEPTLIFIVATIGVALISYLIVHPVIVRSVNSVLSGTNETWGSNLAKHEVLEKVALLVPLMILKLLVPPIISQHPLGATVTDRIFSVMVLVMFIWTILGRLDALNDIANAEGMTRRMPITIYV